MMQPEGYGSIPMDLHISQQGYHPYYRWVGVNPFGPGVVWLVNYIKEYYLVDIMFEDQNYKNTYLMTALIVVL